MLTTLIVGLNSVRFGMAWWKMIRFFPRESCGLMKRSFIWAALWTGTTVFFWQEGPIDLTLGNTKSPGINVWCGLYSGGIVGPVFIEGNINAQNYLGILRQHVIPFMENQFEEMLFQQDGHWPTLRTSFETISMISCSMLGSEDEEQRSGRREAQILPPLISFSGGWWKIEFTPKNTPNWGNWRRQSKRRPVYWAKTQSCSKKCVTVSHRGFKNAFKPTEEILSKIDDWLYAWFWRFSSALFVEFFC